MEANNSHYQDSHASMIKGSAWMTFGSIMSRILGAIYIIPWYAWMGSHGNIANALTAKSYNIYSVFLLISTAGIPGAVAKQVAKYNALNEYGIGRRLFRRGLSLMIVFGVISGAIMYFCAPALATNNIWGTLLHGGYSDPRQVAVMRSLSLAVFIIPVLSILRGYFQGYSDMMPPAMSQFFEQLARVVWMLLTAYFIMQVQHGSYVRAAVQSNYAAAIGAVFGIALLVGFLWKRRKHLQYLYEHSDNALQVSTSSLLWEIVQQSIPFIILDSGITLFQLVDQYSFHPMIAHFVHASSDTIETWYALFGLNANKLIMIIVSLASAMAITAIPLLSAAHTRHDWQDISHQIENILELFLFIMIPASLGMAAISIPVYTIFYGYDTLGSSILYLSAFTAISLGMFTVLTAILQGLSENRLAIRYLLLGLIIKLLLQYPLISLFKIYGPLLATNCGIIAISVLALRHLRLTYHYNASRTSHRFVGIAGFSIIMFLLALFLVKIGFSFLNIRSRVASMVVVVMVVAICALFYGAATLYTGLAERILGSRVTRITARFHLHL